MPPALSLTRGTSTGSLGSPTSPSSALSPSSSRSLASLALIGRERSDPGESSPQAAAAPSPSRSSSRRGAEGWQWCLKPKDRIAPLEVRVGPADKTLLGRSLSSSSTLTSEGRLEAERVLGVSSTWTQGSPWSSRTPARPTLEPLEGYRQPRTTAQIVGSTVDKAIFEPGRWNKNTCDVCIFSDSMHKTKTAYCPHIRF